MDTKKPQGAQHTNPNLIPMIDIMFLLLLFFMLGADMGHRELEDVRLPKADQAKNDPPNTVENRLTINAHHRDRTDCADYERKRICRDVSHWSLTFRGEDCTDGNKLATALARTNDVSGQPLNERRVMVRADGAAPFGLAQRAMFACAKNGIYKVEVGAAKPPTR
jgi:biopolymer transport protein ExbD